MKNNSPQFSVRFPIETYNILKEIKFKEKKSLNEIINIAVSKYIDSSNSETCFNSLIKETRYIKQVQQSTYNLLAQIYCNHHFEENAPIYKDIYYQEFIKKQKYKDYE